MMDVDPGTVRTAIDGIKNALDLFRTAVGLAKDVKEALPESAKREAIGASIEQAERAARVAEAQVAQALGYHLCQCTFPPQIMLSIGLHEGVTERFKCPNCNKLEPSDRQLQMAANFSRPLGGSGSWMGS
jgi:monoamine oxidase